MLSVGRAECKTFSSIGVPLFTEFQDFNGAVTDFTSAIKANPSDDDSYQNRGAVRYAQDKYDLALSDLDKSIQLNPNNGFAYFWRGLVKNAKGNTAGACTDLNKSCKILGEATPCNSYNELCK